MKTMIRAWIATILMGSFIQSVWAADDYYRTYDQVRATLDNLSQTHPGIAKYVRHIGKTIDGLDIPAIKITKDPQADYPNRPDVLFLGGQHAREWIGIEVPLRLAEYLVANYAGDSTVQSLVDSREIWIVPIVNPDGYIFSHTTDRDWRKNRSPQGQYFGVDLNRNYKGPLWGVYSADNPAYNKYHGLNPFSEPETQAIKDFIEGREAANNPITRLLDYHSYSKLILYPWGYTSDPAPDAALFQQIAEEMRNRISASPKNVKYNYKVGQISTIYENLPPRPASGTINDWAYGEKGILAFTIELRPALKEVADLNLKSGFMLPTDLIQATFDENLPAALYFIGLSRGRLVDFENGRDGVPIRSTFTGMAIAGMDFATTEGHDWLFGDWRTQNYNGPYPHGMYLSNGNFFAWLGASQGLGFINFTDSTHKTVGLSYSSYGPVSLDAYDDSLTRVESVSGPGNLNTGQLGKLSVSGDIAYVTVHDSGNYWLIDDLFVTDGLADAQAKMPGNYQRQLEVVEKFDIVDIGSTKQFTVFSQEQTLVKIVLQWPGSTFNLKVIDPEGNLVSETESSEPPIIVDLQTHSEGDWQILVTAIQLDEPEAASLVVGVFEPEDIDRDDVTNDIDNCPGTINPAQADIDVDGVGDVCDNCPTTYNPDQTDHFPLDGPDGYGNGRGDACEALPEDMDDDGIENVVDNCPYLPNPDQLDTDEDNKGDVCDIDNDNDTVPDVTDNCPRHSNREQEDYDNDGLGDACDDDRDGDGVLNSADACAFTEPGFIVDPTGCSIEQLCPCEGPTGASDAWKNHGKYVSCMATSAKHFVKLGLISNAEKGAVVSEAAQSDCGNKK